MAFLSLGWIHQAHQTLRPLAMPSKNMTLTDQPAAPAPLTPVLPRSEDAVQILRMVEGQAKANGLAWPQADYRITPLSDEALAALEIRTTLKGPYPKLRQMIASVLDNQPALALRELTFTRPNGDAMEVEAKIRWAVFLADGWPPANHGDLNRDQP
ncbi:hypothetical protein [Aquabacterium sp.]|uniref:hypothetical protein n=1 Tax=Aquabacterium sp. TaxID=1872578 RepID=UPI00199C193E|nr:hypothetical protein [Aquabacterium sp.]MBC7701776.1 hypothetical protein [Aquabacterium sp.]